MQPFEVPKKKNRDDNMRPHITISNHAIPHYTFLGSPTHRPVRQVLAVLAPSHRAPSLGR